jgi:indolepyruvate ferredoxin oxidoreductase alpha subunit
VETRLAHSRASVSISRNATEPNPLSPDNGKHWILLPAIARRNYDGLIDKQADMELMAEQSKYSRLEVLDGNGLGIIACGIAYNYVKENRPQGVSAILKLNQYPLPKTLVEQLAAMSDRILVAEDGQPFVEESLRALLGKDYQVKGRLTGDLPRTGELTPDTVGKALGKDDGTPFEPIDDVVGRPPALCQGCGHRDVYNALNEVAAGYEGARIFGDIGCYTLGALPPFQSIASCVDMGASITMAKGAADAGVFPAIAVIGDSTFTHSGMTGLLDAVNDKANITVIISDNLTTAMTGGQDSAGTNKFESICLGLGVEPEHVRVVVPLAKNMPEITRVIREEIEYHGVSVIIPRRECVQTLGRKLRKQKAQKK